MRRRGGEERRGLDEENGLMGRDEEERLGGKERLGLGEWVDGLG